MLVVLRMRRTDREKRPRVTPYDTHKLISDPCKLEVVNKFILLTACKKCRIQASILDSIDLSHKPWRNGAIDDNHNYLLEPSIETPTYPALKTKVYVSRSRSLERFDPLDYVHRLIRRV